MHEHETNPESMKQILKAWNKSWKHESNLESMGQKHGHMIKIELNLLTHY